MWNTAGEMGYPYGPVFRLLILTGQHEREVVFTTTAGQKPINGFSKSKARADRLSGVSNWVIHDLGRTMRTHLSALPVEDLVRELVIAHSKPGLHKVYDQHA